MVPVILTINSGLLVIATVFLIFAIGHVILTFTGAVFVYAAPLFIILLISEIILAFHSS